MSPASEPAVWRVRGARLAAGLAVLVFGATLCRRGIILSDEGYLLVGAEAIARGAVLYRDIDAFVAPGVWYLVAALFRLFEPSVLVSRLAALAGFVACLGVSTRIVARLADARFAAGCAAAYLVLCVWAFPAWTWSFYSPYSVLFALCALERTLAWRAGGRPRELYCVGLALAASVLFKQNYGALAALGTALAVAAIRSEAGVPFAGLPRELAAAGLRVGAGAAALGLPCLAYFTWHGALDDVASALLMRPFSGFLGRHDIAYLPLAELITHEAMQDEGRLTYGAYSFSATALRFDWPRALVRGIEGLHVLLYWLPPALFAVAAGLLVRSRAVDRRPDGPLAATLALSGLVFLGVFPRADFNHLMNVYQPVIVLGGVVAHRLHQRRHALARGIRIALAASLAVVAAVMAGVAGYWYADLLRRHSAEVAMPRGGVLVEDANRAMLAWEVEAIQRRTAPGEPVLTLPGLSMLNFLAERPQPGRYANLYSVHIAHDGGLGVVEASERGKIELVVADYFNFFSETVGMREFAPLLTSYLRRTFEPVLSVAVDMHLFLRRRPTPLPDRVLGNALADCDVTLPFDWYQRGVYEHLLFLTLYHPLDVPSRPLVRDLSTRCRVRVPEAAALRFFIGLRQPTVVAPGSAVRYALWATPAGAAREPTLLFDEAIAPTPLPGWDSPPPLERLVDLSAWAGAEIELRFQNTYAGQVSMNPLDLRGFVAFWQDVQLESPREASHSR